MASPTPPVKPIKVLPIEAILFFIRSMRTSARLTGEEAVAWATLEAEFETRKKAIS